MPGPFFIAGTARCGTTQLRQVLGEHPDVYAINWESRFIVDPGGLADATFALTEGYTPIHSYDALRRLSELLTQRIAGYSEGILRGSGLVDEIGHDHFMQAVTKLWERLTWYEYDTIVPPLTYRFGRWQYSPGEARSLHCVIGRHFTDRAELMAIFREFVDDIFGAPSRRAGKTTWCEKSPPGNLLFIPFLSELFPEGKVIAIMRHPAHVAASFLDQPWAPGTLTDVLCFLEPIYRRWLAQRPELLADPRYIEVRSEDLARDWPERRRELFIRLELPDADTPSGFRPEVLDHRSAQLDDKQHAEVQDRLGFAITELGYG
jgi:hypothetical protein